jgi:hypothetical protein
MRDCPYCQSWLQLSGFLPFFKAYQSAKQPFFHAVGVGLQAYDLRMLQDAVGGHRISWAGSMQLYSQTFQSHPTPNLPGYS